MIATWAFAVFVGRALLASNGSAVQQRPAARVRRRCVWQMEQVLDRTYSWYRVRGVLEFLDQLLALELAAQKDRAAFGVDVDLTLGNALIPEQDALDLVCERCIV